MMYAMPCVVLHTELGSVHRQEADRKKLIHDVRHVICVVLHTKIGSVHRQEAGGKKLIHDACHVICILSYAEIESVGQQEADRKAYFEMLEFCMIVMMSLDVTQKAMTQRCGPEDVKICMLL